MRSLEWLWFSSDTSFLRWLYLSHSFLLQTFWIWNTISWESTQWPPLTSDPTTVVPNRCSCDNNNVPWSWVTTSCILAPSLWWRPCVRPAFSSKPNKTELVQWKWSPVMCYTWERAASDSSSMKANQPTAQKMTQQQRRHSPPSLRSELPWPGCICWRLLQRGRRPGALWWCSASDQHKQNHIRTAAW